MVKDILFYSFLVVVGVSSAGIGLASRKRDKLILFSVILFCLLWQGWYGWQEKVSSDRKADRDASYQDESLRNQDAMSKDLKEWKDKEKKGLLSQAEYPLYIAKYLESIDQTLKFRDGKNTRGWISLYYEEINKIPTYFSLENWEESEKLIYDSIVQEIDGQFAARGTFDGGGRPKLLDTFKAARERVLKAKETGK